MKTLNEEKEKLEAEVTDLEKKVKVAVEGQRSRDTLIETLETKIRQLEQQVDDDKVIVIAATGPATALGISEVEYSFKYLSEYSFKHSFVLQRLDRCPPVVTGKLPVS